MNTTYGPGEDLPFPQEGWAALTTDIDPVAGNLTLPDDDWRFVERHFSDYFQGLHHNEILSCEYDSSIHTLAVVEMDDKLCYAIGRSKITPQAAEGKPSVDLIWLYPRGKEMRIIRGYDASSPEAEKYQRKFTAMLEMDTLTEPDLEDIHRFVTELRKERAHTAQVEAMFPFLYFSKNYLDAMTAMNKFSSSVGQAALSWFVSSLPHHK